MFGKRWSLPVGLGPVGLSGIYARRGEVQAARAAKAAGVPFTLSARRGLLDRGGRARRAGVLVPALFRPRPRVRRGDLIARAKAAGCSALVLTVDLAVPGSRYRDARAAGGGLKRLGQLLARPEWLWDVGIQGKPHSLGNLEEIVGRHAPLDDFQALDCGAISTRR